LECPAGYYCEELLNLVDYDDGISVPVLCSEGTYCEAGSNAESNCPIGTYNPF